MLADGRNYLTTSWWIATFPGLAIVVGHARDQPARQPAAPRLMAAPLDQGALTGSHYALRIALDGLGPESRRRCQDAQREA